MKATYIDHMGTDLSVVNAARVSFDKESGWVKAVSTIDWHIHSTLSSRDKKLILYLAEHKHEIPFAHTSISLRIKAPVCIARQAFKHKIGFVENEISRRYVDSDPEFFLPDFCRKRAGDKKQGSSDEKVESVEVWDPVIGPTGNVWNDPVQFISMFHDNAEMAYRSLLKAGVCPEQARMVLPQSMYTEWIWTGSLLAYARFYNLRKDPHAQKEIQDLAQMVGDIIQPLYPFSWAALTKSN